MQKSKPFLSLTLISIILSLALSGCTKKTNDTTQTNILNSKLTHEAEISSDGIPLPNRRVSVPKK